MENTVSIPRKVGGNFWTKFLFFVIFAVIVGKVISPIRLAVDKHEDVPINTNLETDVDWTNPPCNPNDLSNDWKEITDPRMAQNSNRRVFQYKDTEWKLAFEKGDAALRGYAAKDHWHRYNPRFKNDRDFYLDKTGNPVGKNSNPSHILPNCK